MKLSRANRQLFLFGLFKIPLILFVRPKIAEMSDNHLLVRIKLTRRTQNHLKSVYLGALTIGADLASGFLAFHKTKKSEHKISLAFKGMTAEFLKRPMDDVYFLCENGKQIDQMVEKSAQSGERLNEWSEVKVYTDYFNTKDLVAMYEMQVSIKVKS
jgi:hypothetical protein